MNEVRVLPSDVWVEILRRIPTVDLLPLRAVCKNFHRLISDDFFTRLHLDHFTKLHPKAAKAIIIPRSLNNTLSSSNYYDPDKRTISDWHNNEPRFDDWCNYDVTRGYHCHQIIDSCGGLLLIEICARLLLYNPITRSYKFLPSTCDFQQLNRLKIAYDDVSKQYKVFGLKFWAENTVLLYVINVRGDEKLHYPRAKTVWDSQSTILSQISWDNVLVNGSVYWLFKTKEPETLNGEKRWKMMNCIISVNVTNEEVKTRSCPIACSRPYGNFFAANGTFYQLESSYPNNYDPKLWVLEGIESENPNPSWTIKHIIDINHLTSTLSISPNFHIFAVGAFCNKVLIIITMKSECPDRLFQYDMSSKEFEEVTLACDGNNIEAGLKFKYYRIIDHIDSLISP